jgi:hypothetical protein
MTPLDLATVLLALATVAVAFGYVRWSLSDTQPEYQPETDGGRDRETPTKSQVARDRELEERGRL